MDWGPMKNSLRKGRKEDFFYGFKSEDRNLHFVSASEGLQKSKTFKTRVRLFPDFLTLMYISFVLVYFYFLCFVYGSDYSFYTVGSSGLYLLLILSFIFIYPSSKIVVTPGEIVINRPIRRPAVIQRKDIMQISENKNNSSYFLRWVIRLLFIGFILSDLSDYFQGINFNYLIQKFIPAASLLFISETWEPYKYVLTITTLSVTRLWPLSSLKLRIDIYNKEPEGLIRVLNEVNE